MNCIKIIFFFWLVVLNFSLLGQNTKIKWMIEPVITDVDQIYLTEHSSEAQLFVFSKNLKRGVKDFKNNTIIPPVWENISHNHEKKSLFAYNNSDRTTQAYDFEGYEKNESEGDAERARAGEVKALAEFQEIVKNLNQTKYNIIRTKEKYSHMVYFLIGNDTIIRTYSISPRSRFLNNGFFYNEDRKELFNLEGKDILKDKKYIEKFGEEYFKYTISKDLKKMIDISGNEIFPGQYIDLSYIKEINGFIAKKADKEQYLLDINGNKIAAEPAHNIYLLRKSPIIVLDSEKSFKTYNISTKAVNTYQANLNSSEKIGAKFEITKDSLNGIVDLESGIEVIPVKYTSIKNASNFFMATNRKKQKGFSNNPYYFYDVYTADGKLLFSDSLYFNVESFNNGVIFRNKKEVYIYNRDYKEVFRNPGDLSFSVINGGKYFNVSKAKESYIIDAQDFISKKPNATTYNGLEIHDNLLCFQYKGKYGVFTLDGKEILPFMFEKIIDITFEKYLIATVNGKYGVINLNEYHSFKN